MNWWSKSISTPAGVGGTSMPFSQSMAGMLSSRSGWVFSDDIKAGHLVAAISRRNAVVVGKGARSGQTNVYNLAVDGTHTYFVTSSSAAPSTTKTAASPNPSAPTAAARTSSTTSPTAGLRNTRIRQRFLARHKNSRPQLRRGLVVIGGGIVGAAVFGLLAGILKKSCRSNSALVAGLWLGLVFLCGLPSKKGPSASCG